MGRGLLEPLFMRRNNDKELGRVKGFLRRLRAQTIKRGSKDIIVEWIS